MCKITLILIDFQRRGEERDEDGGEKTPANCLTEEYKVVFLDSAESSIIVISHIGIVQGDPIIEVLVWVIEFSFCSETNNSAMLSRKYRLVAT